MTSDTVQGCTKRPWWRSFNSSASPGNVEEMHGIVDGEALQVSDRNTIDHSLATITNEVEVLSRTLSDLLTDPTKM